MPGQAPFPPPPLRLVLPDPKAVRAAPDIHRISYRHQVVKRVIALILVALFPVAGLAEYLTVLRNCLSSLAPGLDVLAPHLAICKMLASEGAYPVLTAVFRHFIRHIKCPQVEQSAREWVCIPAKQKFIDAFCFLHLVIFMQAFYLCAHYRRIIRAVMVCVIEMAPLQTFHIRKVFRENLLYSMNHILEIRP